MSGDQENSLQGRIVALPENRDLDVLAGMLERRGAIAMRCPLVAILDNPDQESVAVWLSELAYGGLDDLILLTGEGLRRLLAAADRMGIRQQAIEAVGKVQKITRGPKPIRALKEIGLTADLTATSPTTAGIMETMSKLPLTGRRVGVQLYGLEPNAPLVEFLSNAGASVRTVSPYVYAPAIDVDRVVELIDRISDGGVDAVAFTSASQVDRLFEVAFESSRLELLTDGLAKIKVAAVGPVVRENLETRGVRVDVSPKDHYFMAPLVQALADFFAKA